MLQINPKMAFVTNNSTIIKIRFQKFSSSFYLNIFEMKNLFIICLVFQLLTCTISVDAQFVIFQNITYKFVSILFGATFAAAHCQFISICSCFCLQLVLENYTRLVAQMRARGVLNLLVVGWISPQQTFYFLKLIFTFFYFTSYSPFFVVVLLVFAKSNFASVLILSIA